MARVTLNSQGELVSFLSAGKADVRSLKVYFSPKQAGTGDPSQENVREISGWTGVSVTECGKNIFSGEQIKSLVQPTYTVHEDEYGKYINVGSTSVIDFPSAIFKENTRYTYIFKLYGASSAICYQVHYTDGSTSNITAQSGVSTVVCVTSANKTVKGIHGMLRAAARRFYFEDSGVFEGVLTTDDYEPYTGTTYNLDWTSEIGTLYGGYVDLISGEVVEEWDIIASYNGESLASEWLSDRDVYVSGTTPTTGAQVAYELATPVTHQLTPTEIQTLTGQNTFWSTADRIEVEYDLIETRDTWMRRRSIIAASQPHLKSLTGTSLQFETDMANKLKECRIHFTPIQEGTGDPSPSNVRPIHGWDGVTVYNNRKVPVEYQEVEYLESTGTQRIELPFGFDPTDEVETRFSISKDHYIDKYIVSPIQWNTNNNRFGMGVHGGTSSLGAGYYTIAYGNVSTSGTKFSPDTLNDGNFHDWQYKNYTFYVIDVGRSKSVLPILFGSTTANLRLFYGYNSNTKGKIASYHHKKANGTEINLIPCYRKSDNEPGMYDTVSGNFYTNEGSGDFLVGNDITGGEAITIPFPQTVYGGYVDLVKGEVVEEWVSESLGNYNWTRYNTATGISRWKCGGIPIEPSEHRNDVLHGLSDKLLPISYNSSWGITYRISQGSAGTTTYVILPTMTLEEANAFLETATLCYKLATPTTYPLDPVTIRTLKGLNNIWSDANGNIEVKFWTH